MAKPSKKAKPKKKTPLKLYVVIAAVIVAAILAGVVLKLVSGSGDNTAGSDQIKLPSFANGPSAPKGAATAYQFALDHPDLLAQIPCYCGCATESNHKSNLDCYIKSRDGNKVSFDDHASY